MAAERLLTSGEAGRELIGRDVVAVLGGRRRACRACTCVSPLSGSRLDGLGPLTPLPLGHGGSFLPAGCPIRVPGCGSMRDDETVNEFPPLPLMQRFLDLCEEYGSERLAVRLVVVGRSTGLLTLPASDDWTT